MQNPHVSVVEKLQWCDQHREELAAMVHRVYQDFQPRDWAEVAKDFTKIVRDCLNQNSDHQEK
ncbi:hypothetical protein CRD_02457 [Raphidiopsis brookii D9]|nr:hypothetical protein CRD_02457 [Raphidiopsis brookii D9]